MPPVDAENGWSSAVHRYAGDHPTGAGHFPDHPLIPGALLLDRVLLAIGTAAPVEISQVKFMRPVQPGDTVIIRWQAREAGTTGFEILLEEGREIAVTGMLRASPR